MVNQMPTYTNEEAIQFFENLFWGKNILCPRCNHTVYRLTSRPLYQCSHCRHQFSLKSLSIMRNSHLPLTTWLLALAIISQGNTNAVHLASRLGISYPSAWLLFHKIRNLMRALSQQHKRHFRYILKSFFFLPGIKNLQKRNGTPFQRIECTTPSSPSLFHIHLTATISPKILANVCSQRISLLSQETSPSFFILFKNLHHRLASLYHYGCRKHPQRYIDEFCFFSWCSAPSDRREKLLSLISHGNLLLPYRKLIQEPMLL
ncbi:MAG: transposase [Brevinematales bacterium]|nr:transposase [Brevinematales bacterium]